MNIVTMLKHSMGFMKQSTLVLAAGAAVLLGSGTAANAQWSYSAWTGDADSGINSAATYTAAVKGNNGSAVTVNGVAFQAYNTTGNFSIGGSVAGPHGPNDPLITGDSKTLAAYFIFNGTPRTVTLSNLTEGKAYEMSFFSFGWEGSGRTQTFASGADSLVVDQDAYGDKQGIRISYVFTADATGSRTFTITPGEGGTFHMSAFANRETTIPLQVNISSPTNNQLFFVGASVTATAAVVETGTAPFTTTFYTNFNGGAYAAAGSDSSSPYTVNLGTLAAGTYGIYAIVSDSGSSTATSATNSFIVLGTPSVLTVAGFPNPQAAGASASVTVTITDSYGRRSIDYTGTVTLTSSDGAAVLPGSYTFTSADAGTKTFTVTLKTVGTHSITAGDGTLTGMQSGISVSIAPPISIYSIVGTSSWTAPGGVTSINLLVVGGGGAGGLGGGAGGGGAGGLIYYGPEAGGVAVSYPVTPGQTYTITVGGGGTGSNGGDSSFGTVVAAGGGRGGSQWDPGPINPGVGGSGGGGGMGPWYAVAGAAASPAGQGYAGGSSSCPSGQRAACGGGGGGAGAAGTNGNSIPDRGGDGGAGLAL